MKQVVKTADEIEVLMRATGEFCESMVVVLVGTPSGPTGHTIFEAAATGNPYANAELCWLWLDGKIPTGSWYVSTAGLLSDEEGDPVPWEDGVSEQLANWSEFFIETVGIDASGVVILATAGDGPSGTTQTYCRVFGNSLACTGAMRNWADRVFNLDIDQDVP